MDGDGPVNVQELVEQAPGRVVVLDSDRRVVASNFGLDAGTRVDDAAGALVLYVGDLQEVRAGFTAAVSHELRTPLARLLVLLESASLPGVGVEELLEQARGEVEQARELVDDLLFLGQLETGREVVSLGNTAARPVVDEVLAALATRAETGAVRLVARGTADLPLRPRMLRVVIENLVENAIRYAGAGATCTVELERGLLLVADDGVGVGRDALPRLFERFFRADAARTTRGTGLGLAIVKHVVTAAGGTVGARVPPRGGLEVACRFPG
jgi:signal transduction histidine kinase